MLTAYEGKSPYIFVSYSHKNTDFVLSVIEQLQRKGFRVWYDGGIEIGTERWPEYIAQHLGGCSCFLAFVSPEFDASDNCHQELTHALKYKKKMVAIHVVDFIMSAGLDMQLGLSQALIRSNYASFDAFINELVNARPLQICNENCTQPPEEEDDEPILPVSHAYGMGVSIASLVRRGHMSMEDGNWEKAEDCFDQALNLDPECAGAYLGLALCEKRICDPKRLIYMNDQENRNYKRAKQFADEELLAQLEGWEAEYAAQQQEALRKKQAEEAAREAARAAREAVRARLQAKRTQLQNAACRISAGHGHTVALMADGTVVATAFTGSPSDDAGQTQVQTMQEITAVSAGTTHTVALQDNGTAVATAFTGNRALYHGQCDLEDWRDLIALSAGQNHTVGLRRNGMALAVGDNSKGQCRVTGWKDLSAICTGYNHTVGLKADGTVVATGDNSKGQCDVTQWHDIVAISAGFWHTVGVRADGTVVCAGIGIAGEQCSQWADIVAVSAGFFHTVGLRADGTVVATGDNKCGQCAVGGWANVLAISAGGTHTVALLADGTLLSTEYIGASTGQCEVSGWKLFDDYQNLEQECALKQLIQQKLRQEAAAEAERQRQLEEALRKQAEQEAELIAEAKRQEAALRLRPMRLRTQKVQDLYITAGHNFTIGLCVDGSPVAAGRAGTAECQVSGWTDIVAVCAGNSYTLGLKSDGTVVTTRFAGNPADNHGQCKVESWCQIKAISTGLHHSVGLRTDGTVVATRYSGRLYSGQCDVENWTDIVAVSAGGNHTVGLRSDGTVVATKFTGSYYSGQCDVESWRGIVAISAGFKHTVGLRSDGTVVATQHICNPYPYSGQCDVENWRDIVAICAGTDFTAGLTADGRVLVTGRDDFKYGFGNTASWQNIVAICVGTNHTVGLRADGTAVTTSSLPQNDLSGWRLFDNLDNLEREKVRKATWRQRGACLYCGGTLHGDQNPVCGSCGKPKNY